MRYKSPSISTCNPQFYRYLIVYASKWSFFAFIIAYLNRDRPKELSLALQSADSLLQQLAGLRLKLLLGRAENLFENGQELRSCLLNGGI